ncbi:MAG: hypothetical protein ACI4F6_08605 [Acutalibacteraceae bacterium]
MNINEINSLYNYDEENVKNVFEEIEREVEDDFAYTIIQRNSYNEAVLSRENAALAADILID